MFDRKLMAVIRREYVERVWSKWFVIATLFGPLLFGGLMIIPSIVTAKEHTAQSARVVIIDATGTPLGTRVASQLAGGVAAARPPRVDIVNGDGIASAESLATTLVLADSVSGYMVLDSATLAAGKARYNGSNTTAFFEMQRVESVLQRELMVWRIEQSGIDPTLGRDLVSTRVSLTTERLSARGRGGSGQVNFFVGFAVAMLLYLVTFIYGLNVLRGVLEEKQTRVAEVVIASVPAQRLLVGKVVGVGGVGLTQIMAWMVLSWGLWLLRVPLLARFGVDAATYDIPNVGAATAALLLAFFLLGFLFYAGLFAAAGALVATEQEAQQVQMPVVLLLASSILFAQNILMQPDGALSRTLSLLPHSAAIVMPIRMAISPVPAGEIAWSLASVGTGALMSIHLAGRIYRTGLLMYGKRPTLREIWRWMRTR